MSFDFFPTELERSARDAWAAIRVGAGLPGTGWRFDLLSRREDPDIARITFRVRHVDGTCYTYKHELRPWKPERFADQVRRQTEAHAAFPHDDRLTVPRPVFADVARQASLMTHIDGVPLGAAMRAAPDRAARLDLLRRAGVWVDAFHRSRGAARAPLDPAPTLRRFNRLRREIRTEEREVPLRYFFIRGIKHVVALAPHVAGQETVMAAQHGDLHMGNLIVAGDRIAGIDISSAEPDPVGRDIAKLLLDYTAHMGEAGALKAGEFVPRDAVAAFFAGYTLVGPDDPGLRFLLGPRLLMSLMRVSADPAARTAAGQRSLERLRPLLRKAFKPDPPVIVQSS